jgi:hypothetical protein
MCAAMMEEVGFGSLGPLLALHLPGKEKHSRPSELLLIALFQSACPVFSLRKKLRK